MSRGPEGRDVAWQVWRRLHTEPDLGVPVAFEHHCGALGRLPGVGKDHAEVVCPGCHFELARPEDECWPLYEKPKGDQ